eukprot:Polyplicarium_translucidae@DN5298_c0_g1_i1.p1
MKGQKNQVDTLRSFGAAAGFVVVGVGLESALCRGAAIDVAFREAAAVCSSVTLGVHYMEEHKVGEDRPLEDQEAWFQKYWSTMSGSADDRTLWLLENVIAFTKQYGSQPAFSTSLWKVLQNSSETKPKPEVQASMSAVVKGFETSQDFGAPAKGPFY